MRILLDNDLIQVVETRQIKGTEEKIYQLSISPQLDETDMQNVSKEQHVQYFLAYILSVLNGFSRYIHQPGERDMLADFVGYSDLYLYMNQEELRSFGSALKDLVHPYTENPAGDGRHLHKVSIITHPETMENPHD
jgi:hypothetical protein